MMATEPGSGQRLMLDLRLAQLYASRRQLAGEARRDLFRAVRGSWDQAAGDAAPPKQSFSSSPRASRVHSTSPSSPLLRTLGCSLGDTASSNTSSVSDAEEDPGRLEGDASSINTSAGSGPENGEVLGKPVIWSPRAGRGLSKHAAAAADEVVSVGSSTASEATWESPGRPSEGADAESHAGLESLSDSCSEIYDRSCIMIGFDPWRQPDKTWVRHRSNLDAAQRTLLSKHSCVFDRLHADMDWLVLKSPRLGEALTALLRELVHGLDIGGGGEEENERARKALELELLGPVSQCGQQVCGVFQRSRNEPTFEEPVVALPPSTPAANAAGLDYPSPVELSPASKERILPEGKLDPACSGKLDDPSRKVERVRPPSLEPEWAPGGPEVEPSPCGVACGRRGPTTPPSAASTRSDASARRTPSRQGARLSDDAGRLRVEDVARAVATAEARCRAELQKKISRLVSAEVDEHFGCVYAALGSTAMYPTKGAGHERSAHLEAVWNR